MKPPEPPDPAPNWNQPKWPYLAHIISLANLLFQPAHGSVDALWFQSHPPSNLDSTFAFEQQSNNRLQGWRKLVHQMNQAFFNQLFEKKDLNR
jgi:hypothetical protein